MGDVVTVTGRVPAERLGIGVVGERLVAHQEVPRPERATDSWFCEQPVTMPMLGDLMMGRANRDDAVLEPAHVRTELERFATVGGGVVVDVTTVDEGRDIAELQRLSAKTGVRIVAAAAASTDPDDIADELRSGAIGIVTVGAAARDDERAAAYAAAVRTGAPVLTDAGVTDPVVLVIDALESGLRPEQIAVRPIAPSIGDREVLRRLAAAGVYLLFDGLGRIPTVRTLVSDHEIAATIASLVAAEAGDRVLLGAGLTRKHAFTAFGGHGLPFVSAQFVPYLRMLGLTDAQADRLITTNVHEFLSWTEAT